MTNTSACGENGSGKALEENTETEDELFLFFNTFLPTFMVYLFVVGFLVGIFVFMILRRPLFRVDNVRVNDLALHVDDWSKINNPGIVVPELYVGMKCVFVFPNTARLGLDSEACLKNVKDVEGLPLLLKWCRAVFVVYGIVFTLLVFGVAFVVGARAVINFTSSKKLEQKWSYGVLCTQKVLRCILVGVFIPLSAAECYVSSQTAGASQLFMSMVFIPLIYYAIEEGINLLIDFRECNEKDKEQQHKQEKESPPTQPPPPYVAETRTGTVKAEKEEGQTQTTVDSD